MSRPRKQEQGEFALMDQLYEANTKVSSMFQCSLLSFRGAANEVNGDRSCEYQCQCQYEYG